MMIDVTAMSSCQPRATGRRVGFLDLPAAVRAWTTEQFGKVEVLREHIGGMSPGCATSLATSSGRRLFIPVDAQETVTSLLLSFGGSQAWNARQPTKPSLPAFAGFCRDDARRLLAIARLRLAA